ncbi:hypothetical protein ACWGCW_00995 [Streptomyces sp. NPDC054933]
MNTYTVTYWPPGGSASVTATTGAAEFMFDDGFVLFVDAQQHPVLAVPTALNPVVTQTASG